MIWGNFVLGMLGDPLGLRVGGWNSGIGALGLFGSVLILANSGWVI